MRLEKPPTGRPPEYMVALTPRKSVRTSRRSAVSIASRVDSGLSASGRMPSFMIAAGGQGPQSARILPASSKIGRYMETRTMPTRPPTTTMRSGSRSEVSEETATSTSSS